MTPENTHWLRQHLTLLRAEWLLEYRRLMATAARPDTKYRDVLKHDIEQADQILRNIDKSSQVSS